MAFDSNNLKKLLYFYVFWQQEKLSSSPTGRINKSSNCQKVNQEGELPVRQDPPPMKWTISISSVSFSMVVSYLSLGRITRFNSTATISFLKPLSLRYCATETGFSRVMFSPFIFKKITSNKKGRKKISCTFGGAPHCLLRPDMLFTIIIITHFCFFVKVLKNVS